eukprot:6492684-Amphidinium_carterae.2
MSAAESLALGRLLLLPHVCQLADVMVPLDCEIIVSCEDARDYFYLLRAPPARVEETLVGFALHTSLLTDKAKECGGLEKHFEGEVVLALRAPAMGDKKSVELAQIVHHWSLMRADALRADRWLTFGYPCPGGRHLCGAYVDDLGLVSLCSKSYDASHGCDTLAEHHEIIDKAREGYLRTGIERKPEKSKEAEKETTLWGAHVSSARLEVSGDTEKMGVLVEATLLLLRQRAARVIEVRRIVGYWTHYCLLARPLLCLMCEVYKWIEQGKGKERVLRPLTARLRDELWGLALLHPFMKVHLTSVVNPCVYATDATTSWGAVTRKVSSIPEALFMWSRKRPRHARMWTSPGGCGADLLSPEPGSSVLARDSEMEQVLETMQFVECFRFRFHTEEHINRLEGQAAKAAVKFAVRDPRQWGSRLVLLVDSQVIVHVLQRGRSSSRPLNQMMRSLLPHLLGSRTTLVPLWVHTTCNPADDPTRGQRVRRARKRKKNEEELLAKACEDHPVALFCMEQSLRRGEKTFDGSLGYPGEGPFPAGRPREGKDLLATVQPLTQRRYDARVRALEEWLTVRGYPEMRVLKTNQPLMLCALKAYLEFLYENSKPVTWGTDLLAGLQFHHPEVIGRMGEVWSMQRQWQRLQPGQFRVPMPLSVLLAFCVLAWHWQWYRVAASLLLGYHLMLRPSELTGVLRHHLVLPCDLSGDMSSGVLCIPRSKTSDRASRLQSVVIEDGLILRVALAVFGRDLPRVPLMQGGMRMFLVRFQQLKQALGLEHTAFNLLPQTYNFRIQASWISDQTRACARICSTNCIGRNMLDDGAKDLKLEVFILLRVSQHSMIQRNKIECAHRARKMDANNFAELVVAYVQTSLSPHKIGEFARLCKIGKSFLRESFARALDPDCPCLEQGALHHTNKMHCLQWMCKC